MFHKASKSKSKLRLAIFGPSGGGKTFTAMRMATGMGGKIAVIDSERGSASLYADKFHFDVCELSDMSIGAYVNAMKAAKGYEVLIVDSMTHAWQDLLQEVESLAQRKYRGNTWSAWSEGTPKQKTLIDALLDFPGHIIATMRSKTAWAEEKDERSGKLRPVRIGLAPEQGKGIEYEFSILMELNAEHYARIIKDRTGKYQDKEIFCPGEDFGRELVEWLATGEAPEVVDEAAIAAIRSDIVDIHSTADVTTYAEGVKSATEYNRPTKEKAVALLKQRYMELRNASEKQPSPA